jgi:adenylate cyclase
VSRLRGIARRGPPRRVRWQLWGFAATGLIACAIPLALYALDGLERIELQTVDGRFSIRGERAPPDDVAVVLIDNQSLERIGTFPFPRSVHGDVIEALHRDGARVIAYDVQFTEPSPEPSEDRALARAIERADGVVLGTESVKRNGGSPVFGGEAVVRGLGATSGSTGVFPSDPGGVYRRMGFSQRGLESFDLRAVELAEGAPVVPPAGTEAAWIDYAGPPGTFATVPFWEVATGDFERGLFRDRIVVVGAGAQSLGDSHATSFSGARELMAGPEIHANAIQTARAGFPLRATPGWVDVALILVLGLCAPVTSIVVSARIALLTTLAAGVVFLVGTQLAFQSGWITSFSYPLLALVLAALGSLLVHYVGAAVDRLRVRTLFGRFVPESVVGQLLSGMGSELRLGGVRREATILFSDLRAFTTFSEQHSPDIVIEVVNRYLTEMSAAILDNGGTLLSFMGDGILAMFGAPLQQDDHARRAVRTAREMVGERLDAFNDWAVGEGLGDPFRMGVGINTGEVMAGNVGSERRLDYTAIGDTVNTASRLEGMTKGSSHSVFISDSTRDAVGDADDGLVEVGEMPVRGRMQPVKIWSFGADGE